MKTTTPGTVQKDHIDIENLNENLATFFRTDRFALHPVASGASSRRYFKEVKSLTSDLNRYSAFTREDPPISDLSESYPIISTELPRAVPGTPFLNRAFTSPFLPCGEIILPMHFLSLTGHATLRPIKLDASLDDLM